MRLVSRLVGLMMLVGIAGAAEATPVYYTFTGEITQTYDYLTGIVNDPLGGLAVGDSVSYTFLVDTSLPGTQRYLGVTSPTGGFYVDFIGGGPLLPMTGTGQDFEYNYGFSYYLVGSRGFQYYDVVEVVKGTAADISTWVVGDSGFYSYDYVDDRYGTGASGQYFHVYSSDLTLTSISDIAPIPEPGTVALLGAGLLGLVALRRRAA